MATPLASVTKAASSALVGEGVSPRRKHIAIGIAGASDLLQMALFPVTIEGAASPGELALDAVTAVVMMLVLGFQWRLAAAFAIELIPGVALFPTWTAVALMLPTRREVSAEDRAAIDTTGVLVEEREVRR